MYLDIYKHENCVCYRKGEWTQIRLLLLSMLTAGTHTLVDRSINAKIFSTLIHAKQLFSLLIENGRYIDWKWSVSSAQRKSLREWHIYGEHTCVCVCVCIALLLNTFIGNEVADVLHIKHCILHSFSWNEQTVKSM